jgi:thiol-disulfide isomerase/thioredoxin
MKYLFSFIVILVFAACSSEEETSDKKDLPDNFTVSGKISNAQNSTIYLEAYSQKGTIPVADTKIETDGTFSLKGNIPGIGIYQLRLGESKDKVIPMTLVPNDNAKVNTSFENYSLNPSVSGTTWANALNGYMKLLDEFRLESSKLQIDKNINQQELMAKYLVIKQPLDAFALREMKKNPANPFNIILSSSAVPTTGFEGWNPENLALLKKVAKAFEQRYNDSPITATFLQQVVQIESAYNEYKGNSQTAAGFAPEITLKTPEGKTLSLSSLRGKIILVDFWASWCRPCRMENPNVVRLYNQYKDKGFTVFSVSLDTDKNAWMQAIMNDGLTWPNHVSDLLGWETPMTRLYDFESIPHTVLIGKDGKIIATGLRGASLEQKLKELLSK